ncbi:MAG: hypothetical protein NC412_12445 [Roseburia sp.]|nr:hypothetical protein [Roseburia sp.]MCM1279522.1 hypothetical protein [Robinsoniella sp.]
MGYRIGSFNLYKFSLRSDEHIKKNMQKIAKIIRKADLDVVAIQEIFNKKALDRLISELTDSERWEGRWASPNSRSVSAAEGYAFIWKNARLRLAENRDGKVFEPRILNQYKVDKSFGQKHLIRNPYYIRLTPAARSCNRSCKRELPLLNGPFAEIRLINTHIMFSKNRDENESDNHDFSDLGAVSMRRNEFDILSKVVYPKYSDKTYDLMNGERDAPCMPAYTIMLGDYNLNLKSGTAQGSFLKPDEEIIELADERKRIVTVQGELTTLKSKKEGVSYSQADGYANNYDHFTYDEKRFEGITLDVKRIEAVKECYGDDFDLYRKEVSDHLPIVLDLEFR